MGEETVQGRVPKSIRSEGDHSGFVPHAPEQTPEPEFPLGSIWNQGSPDKIEVPDVVHQTSSTPTTERPIRRAAERGPQEYDLPPGVIIFDEEGHEIDRITKPTRVSGTWSRPSKRQGGPAPKFTFESVFPLGQENSGRRIKGIVKRHGKLWFGQTTEDLGDK